MTALVDGDWLEHRLGEEDLVVLDVSFYPPSKAAWFEGHVPGSHYVYWKDLCWDDTDRQFPEPDEMSRRLGAFGADDHSTIVLIGDPIQFATYAYWVLALTGFEDQVVVLDGGHATWTEQGRRLTLDPTTVEPSLRPESRSPGAGWPGRAR